MNCYKNKITIKTKLPSHEILWSEREFKIAVMKKVNELEEIQKRQFNEFRNKTNE